MLPGRLRKWRNRRGFTTSELAEKMGELGQPIHASAVTKIEKGDRGVTLDEWIAFAAALNVPPVALILPLDGAHARVHLTTKSEIHPHLALEWIIGAEPLASTRRYAIDQTGWQEGSHEVRLWHRLRVAQDAVHTADQRLRALKDDEETRQARIERLRELVATTTEMQRAGVTPPQMPAEWRKDIESLGLEGDI